jgi:hypothetical protein
MSSINTNNPFTSFNLSPDEEIQGKLLNEYQKMSLQNISAELALRKVNLDWALDPLVLRLENAQLSGGIEIIERILRECSEAELYIREANQANFNAQQQEREVGQGGNFFNPSVIFKSPSGEQAG